jgi:hypothetical protein
MDASPVVASQTKRRSGGRGTFGGKAMKTFKQEVILALLSNIDAWMPKFDSAKQLADYLSEDTPETIAEGIEMQAKAIAVVADLTAYHIDRISND